ncbi:hypothetical protein DFH07DRAFT_984400, partial [Mycena maculata]
LHRASAGDAFHDSGERFPPPRCHPETRVKLLDELLDWASGTGPRSTSSKILWFHGPAGAGKSAVAQSLCQRLQEQRLLGGSFFFKRGHPSRGNANKLFPTIAYQLALMHPELSCSISQTVERDPAIVDRSLRLQLENLIVGPCGQALLTLPFCVVIDGLDECDSHNNQQEILKLISKAVHEAGIPLLFLIASRPEPHIQEVFRHLSFDGFYYSMNIEQSFDDVRRYLEDEFHRIHQEHNETMATVPLPWPFPSVLYHLVEKSSGYFIYASTVIKFIDNKDFRPTERLRVIMGISTPEAEDDSPFQALDQLYIQIL